MSHNDAAPNGMVPENDAYYLPAMPTATLTPLLKHATAVLNRSRGAIGSSRPGE